MTEDEAVIAAQAMWLTVYKRKAMPKQWQNVRFYHYAKAAIAAVDLHRMRTARVPLSPEHVSEALS